MKNKNGMIIASLVHTTLWIVILLISIIGRAVYKDPEMEPLDFLLSKGVYNAFILVAATGLFNAILLLFSLRSVLTTAITKSRVLEKTALFFSIITNMLFYLSVILVFLMKTDAVMIVPIVWALCAVCCFVILIVLGVKKIMHSSSGDFNSIDDTGSDEKV